MAVAFSESRGWVRASGRPWKLERRLPVGAGARTEIFPAPATKPTIAPAPGSVPTVDEGQTGLRVYRVCASGELGGWTLAAGSSVLLSRRTPEPGDLIAVATRRSIHLALADGRSRGREGRVIGVVEGVIHSRGTTARRRLF